MTDSDYTKLMDLLADAQVVDASQIIWSLRSVKSALEIERMRRACDINIKAFEKGLNSIYEGMTELELLQTICAEMFRLGADTVFPLGIRAGADRYSHSNSPPGDRPIGKGEIVLIDGGPGYRGYFSDIIREACIGQPTPRQRELFDISKEACMVGVEMAKPGVTPAEITQAIDNFIDKKGYSAQYVSRGSCGHSIGLDIHEVPLVDLNTNTPLEEGMVLSIEPSLYEEGMGMFNIEENILITRDGYELLTPLNHDLWIL